MFCFFSNYSISLWDNIYSININLLKLTEKQALIQAGGYSCSHGKILQGFLLFFYVLLHCFFVFSNCKIYSSLHLAFWVEDPTDKYDVL